MWVTDDNFEKHVLDKDANVLLGIGLSGDWCAPSKGLREQLKVIAGLAGSGDVDVSRFRVAYADAEQLSLRQWGFKGMSVPRLYLYPEQSPSTIPVPDVPFANLEGCTATEFQVSCTGGVRWGLVWCSSEHSDP